MVANVDTLDMINTQLRRRGIADERVLAAVAAVVRREFVPDRLRLRAYDDCPLPIGHNQTISQPYVVALMTEGLPPNARPAEAEALMAPRLLELCFQAAGLWLLEKKHTMGLPTALGRATVHRTEAAAAARRVYATVQVRDAGQSFDARVVDETGLVLADVAGYRTIALPGQRTLGS